MEKVKRITFIFCFIPLMISVTYRMYLSHICFPPPSGFLQHYFHIYFPTLCFYQSVLPFISLSFFLHWIQIVLSVCMWVKDLLIEHGNLIWTLFLKKSDTISFSLDKLSKCVVSFWVRNSQKVLVSNQNQCQSSVLFWEFQCLTWSTVPNWASHT